MLFWIGIDVGKDLDDFKRKVLDIGNVYKINKETKLPYHISLKISFEIDNRYFNEAMDFLNLYFLNLKPIEIQVKGIEELDTIVWLRMKDNPILDRIHKDLDNEFYNRFNVNPNPLDLDYQFHVCLFINDNQDLLHKAYLDLKNIKYKEKLIGDTILIGGSFISDIDNYEIFNIIKLKWESL